MRGGRPSRRPPRRRTPATSRLFPTPGSPYTVTRCGWPSEATRSKTLRSSVISRSRATIGVRYERPPAVPRRLAEQLERGHRLLDPLAARADRSPRAGTRGRRRPPGRTPGSGPGPADSSRRWATFTATPGHHALARPRLGRRDHRPDVDPDVHLEGQRRGPRRATGSGPPAIRRIRSAARIARVVSSSCATGTPNTAITASPMNFSTVPPSASMTLDDRVGERVHHVLELLGVEPFGQPRSSSRGRRTAPRPACARARERPSRGEV